MRVLLTSDAVGGVWTYALTLTGALRTHGVEVVLAVLGPQPNARQRADARRCGVSELHGHPGRLEWMADPWDDVDAAGEWLVNVADSTRADIVHLNGYAHAALEWSAPVIVAAHSCVASWWRAVHGREAPAEWAEYRRRVRAGLNAADVVVFPTRALLDAMEAEHGVVRAARVIHNGTPVVPCTDEITEPLVLAAGRFWDEGKNLRVLRLVAPRLDWPVYVAGDCGPDGSSIQADGLVALGHLERDDLRGWQQRAAIAVHPARYEPFGYGALEAAQAGCALVLSDIASLRELWDGAASFASADDPEAIAAAVNRLIADPAALAVMRARATRRARAFSAGAMASAFANVYREQIQARQGGAACAS
jgi:glycogen synthase